MPDDRFFHKSLGHSDKVNKLTDFEDLVWRSYILAADDFGVMRFSAITLRAENDRLARKSAKVVQRALESVRAVKLIHTFEHQGRTYCYQRNWQDYQKITYPKRTINPKPTVEEMIQCTDNTRWLFQVHDGGKKIPTWAAPEAFRRPSVTIPEPVQNPSGAVLESVQTPESLTRGRTLTLAMTNGSDSDSSEPFDSFSPPLPPNDPAARAGDFVERYKALHIRLRRGAHYTANPEKDFSSARQLVGVFDDATLDKLAFVWLNTDLDFAQKGTRTITKFLSQASWCQEELIKWEDQYGPLEVAS